MDKEAEVKPSAQVARLLARSFFEAPPEAVAPQLLGKVLQHQTEQGTLSGRIVEVEAYLGPHNLPPDPAAHAFRGVTDRNRVLFGPAGHAYVYAIYGRYFCMNVSCEQEGRAGCVLLRALEPLAGLEAMALNRGIPADSPAKNLTSGPSRLCQAFGLTRAGQNMQDVLSHASALRVLDDGWRPERIVTTPRIGIKEAVDWPLRFAVAGHGCVSGPRSMR